MCLQIKVSRCQLRLHNKKFILYLCGTVMYKGLEGCNICFPFSIRWQPADYKFIKKETLAQVFSYELREISKNIFCIEHLPITASVVS